MKKISRERAESLFLDSEVINTRIKQDKNELCVIMTLNNHITCHVTYNFSNKKKSYLLQESENSLPPKIDPIK